MQAEGEQTEWGPQAGSAGLGALLKMGWMPKLVWLSGPGVVLQSESFTGSIPSQGTCLDCRFGPWLEHVGKGGN